MRVFVWIVNTHYCRQQAHFAAQRWDALHDAHRTQTHTFSRNQLRWIIGEDGAKMNRFFCEQSGMGVEQKQKCAATHSYTYIKINYLNSSTSHSQCRTILRIYMRVAHSLTHTHGFAHIWSISLCMHTRAGDGGGERERAHKFPMETISINLFGWCVCIFN